MIDHAECANELESVIELLRELLQMEEMDFGDHSQLPEDHPIARAEALTGRR